MRSAFKFALLALLWMAIAAPAARAQADEAQDGALISAEQGQALADFALHSGPRVRPKPDCSHLVHLLYARAGLVYPYEDSRSLYRGISDFERVKTPQPGDLAVWLGHVGIVLSPEDKSFLSSVRSGIITESWAAPHWKRRGRPHFYRYRIGAETNVALLNTMMEREAASHHSANIYARTAVTEPPQIAGEDENDAQQRAPETAPAQGQGRQDEDGNFATQEDSHSFSRIEDEGAGADAAIVAIIRQHSTPNRRQIAAAITENAHARARHLIGGEMLDLGHPLSVFDRLEVTKISIRHDEGTVTLRLNETMAQDAGRLYQPSKISRELKIARRKDIDKDGVWVITDPQGRIYLPQAESLSVFEHQVALFLDRAPNSSGTRMVVKALDRIYDQQPGAPQRAAIR